MNEAALEDPDEREPEGAGEGAHPRVAFVDEFAAQFAVLAVGKAVADSPDPSADPIARV
jgi:hypothetical protein